MKILDTSGYDGVLFHSHLGLGDQIGCNGLVHYLRDQYKIPIHVATKEKNLKNISFLYKDYNDVHPIGVSNNPSSERMEVEDLSLSLNLNLVRTSINNPLADHWDETHYTNLGLDYDIKFDFCKLPTIPNEMEILRAHTPFPQPYAFSHINNDGPKPTTALPIIHNVESLNAFELMPILKNATELHLMGSSVICLAELMNVPLAPQKCFHYTFRSEKDFGSPINLRNNSKWSVVRGLQPLTLT